MQSVQQHQQQQERQLQQFDNHINNTNQLSHRKAPPLRQPQHHQPQQPGSNSLIQQRRGQHQRSRYSRSSCCCDTFFRNAIIKKAIISTGRKRRTIRKETIRIILYYNNIIGNTSIRKIAIRIIIIIIIVIIISRMMMLKTNFYYHYRHFRREQIMTTTTTTNKNTLLGRYFYNNNNSIHSYYYYQSSSLLFFMFPVGVDGWIVKSTVAATRKRSRTTATTTATARTCLFPIPVQHPYCSPQKQQQQQQQQLSSDYERIIIGKAGSFITTSTISNNKKNLQSSSSSSFSPALLLSSLFSSYRSSPLSVSRKSRLYFSSSLSFSSSDESLSGGQHETTATTEFSLLLQQANKKKYEELKRIASEIAHHDRLYYVQSKPQISDDEYDALVQKEAAICIEYPTLLKQYETDSGLGSDATRYGGRIGPIGDDNQQHTTPTATTATATTKKKKKKSKQKTAAKTKTDEVVDVPTIITKKRKHLEPMLSLDNVHDTKQLMSWLERMYKKLITTTTTTPKNNHSNMNNSITVLTEPKLDGVSLSIRYTKKDALLQDRCYYELEWACTRGDGQQGVDVTNTVLQGKLAPSILQTTASATYHGNCSLPDIFEIRGEVVLPISAFQQLQQQQQRHPEDSSNNNNSDDAPFFSNARNAASGILLRKHQEQEQQSTEQSQKNSNNSESSEIGIATTGNANEMNTSSSNGFLQSKLRFYAYDIIFGNKVDDDTGATTKEKHEVLGIKNEIVPNNYLQIREILQSFGFAVPQPTTITKLLYVPKVTNNVDDDGDHVDDNNTSSRSWEESDIPNILDYHEQLRLHRLNPQGHAKKDATAKGTSYFSSSTTADATDMRRPAGTDKVEVLDEEWGDYEMDGCVHKVCELDIRRAVLSGGSRRAPAWAVAHKFPPTAVVTALIGIEVQVGRTGALTPVAVLEPVDINGVLVQRATLHNFVQLQNILLGSTGSNATSIPVGTSVIVRRAGDVIPQVVSRVGTSTVAESYSDSDQVQMISLSTPTHCPACGSPVVIDTPPAVQRNKKAGRKKKSTPLESFESPMQLDFDIDEQTGTDSNLTASSTGRILRCGGPPLLCPPRAVGALQHAFSRDALDITGLSEARIRQLIDANILHRPNDLFKVFGGNSSSHNDGHADKLEVVANLEGWGPRSMKNLESNVQRVASGGVTLSRFIYSLGIRMVGVHSSSLLASIYGTADAFFEDLENATAVETATRSSEPSLASSNDTHGTMMLSSSESERKQEHERDIAAAVPEAAFSRLREDNEATKGIGPVLRSSLFDFAQNKELVDAARKLSRAVRVHDDKTSIRLNRVSAEENGTNRKIFPFDGLKVVFTGSISSEITRSQAQTYAKEMGAASTPNSISRATDLLVVGSSSKGDDKDDDVGIAASAAAANTKKREKAMQLGVKVIDATEFVHMWTEFSKNRPE